MLSFVGVALLTGALLLTILGGLGLALALGVSFETQDHVVRADRVVLEAVVVHLLARVLGRHLRNLLPEARGQRIHSFLFLFLFIFLGPSPSAFIVVLAIPWRNSTIAEISAIFFIFIHSGATQTHGSVILVFRGREEHFQLVDSLLHFLLVVRVVYQGFTEICSHFFQEWNCEVAVLVKAYSGSTKAHF